MTLYILITANKSYWVFYFTTENELLIRSQIIFVFNFLIRTFQIYFNIIMYIYKAPNKIIMLCIIHRHNINFFYLENKSYRLRKQTVGSYIAAFKSTYLSINH